MNPTAQSENTLLDTSRIKREAIFKPVNNTSIEHRGRNRGTDTASLLRIHGDREGKGVIASMKHCMETE